MDVDLLIYYIAIQDFYMYSIHYYSLLLIMRFIIVHVRKLTIAKCCYELT